MYACCCALLSRAQGRLFFKATTTFSVPPLARSFFSVHSCSHVRAFTMVLAKGQGRNMYRDDECMWMVCARPEGRSTGGRLKRMHPNAQRKTRRKENSAEARKTAQSNPTRGRRKGVGRGGGCNQRKKPSTLDSIHKGTSRHPIGRCPPAQDGGASPPAPPRRTPLVRRRLPLAEPASAEVGGRAGREGCMRGKVAEMAVKAQSGTCEKGGRGKTLPGSINLWRNNTKMPQPPNGRTAVAPPLTRWA